MSYITAFMSNLNNLFKENTIKYVIKKKDILLGLKSKNRVNSSLCNSLILTMKYYIYVMKIKKVTFQLYIRYLKHRIQIEKQIAINQDKFHTYDKKYEKLNSILHD